MTRIMVLAGLLFCLAGCSYMQQQDIETDVDSASSAVLQDLQQTLPGLYGNFAQHWVSRENEAQAIGHWRLSVESLHSAPGEAWFSLLQYPATDAGQGHTLLLRFSVEAEQLLLRFAPWPESTPPRDLESSQLTAKAQFLPGCQIRLTRLTGALAGQTNASTCSLVDANGAMLVLVKDFALSATTIDIGDRLTDPATGDSLREDSIFRFNRMLHYQGWAGIRPEAENEWQLASPLEVWSDGGTAQLVDIAGDAMGYSIRLAQVPWRTDQDKILRLDLVDRSTGEVIAYSWSDTTAENIGINLGWIQVGLTQTLP